MKTNRQQQIDPTDPESRAQIAAQLQDTFWSAPRRRTLQAHFPRTP